jgi:hypothetical protein
MSPHLPPSPADVPDESNVETRTVLAFTVRLEALAAWLPAGWQPAPASDGPAQGANLNVIFADRLLVQTAEGATTNQLAVLAIPARRTDGVAAGVLIAYGLSAQAAGSPGYYQVFVPAKVGTERTARTAAGTAHVAEHWDFASADGEQLTLALEYTRGVPRRSSTTTEAYSAHNPARHRTYRADQGASVLRSVPLGTDALSRLSFQAAGPRLAALFDGSEQLVSVIALAWTVRQAFLPVPGA